MTPIFSVRYVKISKAIKSIVVVSCADVKLEIALISVREFYFLKSFILDEILIPLSDTITTLNAVIPQAIKYLPAHQCPFYLKAEKAKQNSGDVT